MLELSGTEAIQLLSLDETSAEQSDAIDLGGEIVGDEFVGEDALGGEAVGACSRPLVQPTVAKTSVATPSTVNRTGA
jgi:hypothetical protein